MLPGIVAFAAPVLIGLSRSTPRLDPVALSLLAFGMAILFACVRAFYVAGKGTLAPWSPPTRLVTGGLYRYSRNPMYIGVLLILAGWAVLFRSPALAIYMLFVGTAFNASVFFSEEPKLARTFGEAWEVYRRDVPRWLGFPRVR